MTNSPTKAPAGAGRVATPSNQSSGRSPARLPNTGADDAKQSNVFFNSETEGLCSAIRRARSFASWCHSTLAHRPNPLPPPAPLAGAAAAAEEVRATAQALVVERVRLAADIADAEADVVSRQVRPRLY